MHAREKAEGKEVVPRFKSRRGGAQASNGRLEVAKGEEELLSRKRQVRFKKGEKLIHVRGGEEKADNQKSANNNKKGEITFELCGKLHERGFIKKCDLHLHIREGGKIKSNGGVGKKKTSTLHRKTRKPPQYTNQNGKSHQQPDDMKGSVFQVTFQGNATVKPPLFFPKRLRSP